MPTRHTAHIRHNAPVSSPEALQGFLFYLKGVYVVQDIFLSDATMSEVLARVAYAYIVKRYRDTGMVGSGPPYLLDAIIAELRALKLTQLQFWCVAYKMQWAPLYSLTLARENFIHVARRGRTWRHVAYPPYKRNR